jgi:hypothetical protein
VAHAQLSLLRHKIPSFLSSIRCVPPASMAWGIKAEKIIKN